MLLNRPQTFDECHRRSQSPVLQKNKDVKNYIPKYLEKINAKFKLLLH